MKYLLYDVLSDYSQEIVEGTKPFDTMQAAKKKAIEDNKGKKVIWRKASIPGGKLGIKRWYGSNEHEELIYMLVGVPQNARKENPSMKLGGKIFKHGMKLRNGAIAIDYDENAGVVLASWKDGEEFVTWNVDPQGATYLGHYFTNITDAVKDYEKRVKARKTNPVKKKTTRKKKRSAAQLRNDKRLGAMAKKRAKKRSKKTTRSAQPARRGKAKPRKSNPVNYYQIFKCKGNSVYWLRGFTAEKSEPRFTLTRGDAARYESQKRAKFIAESMSMLRGWQVGVAKKGTALSKVIATCKGGKA